MQLDLVLPLRDPAGLKSFLNDVYDPTSFSYRRLLTVAEFTERFGPTQADYDAVVSFAKSNGFEVVGRTRDGMEVQIKGPVSAVEKAFHVTLNTYRHPGEERTYYGPDREPTTSLRFPLWHVSGLDNFSQPHPLFVKKSDYAKAHGIPEDKVVTHATTGSGPSASFLGSDMRAAYYGGTALTGAGQNLGLFEFEGTDLADLNKYFANVGQTNNVPITLLSTDGTTTSCLDTRAGGDCGNTGVHTDCFADSSVGGAGQHPGSSTITTAVSGGFSSAIALAASGLPTGVTASFSPASIAAPGSGTSKLTLTVASTAAAGTSTITITGTGGGITHTATVSLTVTAAAAGTFSVSVSPTSGYLDCGQSGYAVVTVTGSGGFDSAVALSAAGVPSGVTGSFSPTSITGSGTSDFTLTVSRSAPIGTYPITITGKSGSTTQTTTLNFSIER